MAFIGCVSIVGDCVRSLNSVLPMVCRWRNAKALHLVKQCGALQAKPSRCSSRASELPIRTLAGGQNFSTHFIFQRRVCNLWLWLQRCTAIEGRRFKNSIIGKNDAAGGVVLQLANVAGPAMANQCAHGCLWDGLDGLVHR